MKNHTPDTYGLKATQHRWDVFDALPVEVKRVLWYAPKSMTTGKHHITNPAPLEAKIAQLMPIDTCKAYGPEHPQADTIANRLGL